MALDSFRKTPTQIDTGLAEIANEVWPNPHKGRREGRKYRELVLQEFLKRNGEPQKRKNGTRYRTENETRLDRAWNDVAETVDRHEPTVRECTLRMYEGDPNIEPNAPGRNFPNLTTRFRADLIEIERRWQAAKSD